MTLNLPPLLQPRLLWSGIAAFGLVLAFEWGWPAGGDPLVPPPRLPIGHAVGQPAALRETAAWGETILQRPLFTISRRPPRAVRNGGQVAAVGQARLAGIMISRTGRRAIFAPEGGGKQRVLAEGAAVNDSTIRRIQPDRVILASGTVLLPAYDKNRSQATTPPFQPPPPNFAPPGFTAPGFPGAAFNPAFPNPNFPNPAMAPQGMAAPPPPVSDDSGPVTSIPPSPRNQFAPQRRD